MKLLSNLILLTFVCLLLSCGGGDNATETTEDLVEETTEEAVEETTEEVTEAAENVLDLEDEDVKMLVNTWKMISFTHVDGRSEENLEGDYLVLNEDGSFLEIIKNDSITGIWNLRKEEEEGKVLVLKPKTGEFAGQTEKLAVKDLQPNQMITEDDGGKMTETFIVEGE